MPDDGGWRQVVALIQFAIAFVTLVVLLLLGLGWLVIWLLERFR